MARHYSTRDFFRQMPNTLLAPYFQARGLFGDLDFAAMRETQPDKLFVAWLDMPDTQRNEMDADFREIFDLSCEKGFRAILDEAEWHLARNAVARTAFVEKLAALLNHFERAMVTFLDHNPFWKGATLFYHADTLPYWRAKHASHLVLLGNGELKLSLAGHSTALADVLELKGDRFSVDRRTLDRLVNQPVAGAGDAESAEQRRERLKARVRAQRARGTRAFL